MKKTNKIRTNRDKNANKYEIIARKCHKKKMGRL